MESMEIKISAVLGYWTVLILVDFGHYWNIDRFDFIRFKSLLEWNMDRSDFK